MDLNNMVFWELVLDLGAFFLCGLAIIFLVLWRFERMSARHESLAKRREAVFDGPKEGFRDSEARGGNAIAETAPKKPVPAPEKGFSIRRQTSQGPVQIQIPSDDPHDAAHHLAEMGFTPEDISREIGIPKGEVKLVMKLRGKINGRKRPDTSMGGAVAETSPAPGNA